MPEGDSIHWLAEKVRRVALQKVVRKFSAHTITDQVGSSLVGHTITEVVARGKNLLIRFDDGRALHIHLRMLGRVVVRNAAATNGISEPARSRTVTSSLPPSVQPRPNPWRVPQLVLDVDGAEIRGSRIPVLRLLKAGEEERSPELNGLGPDLLAAELDEGEALRRLRALGKLPIGEALLVQRAVAGIGNVYKSELLFLERIDPRKSIAQVEDEALTRVLLRGRKLLALNVRSGPRVTRNSLAGRKSWVYGRKGKACFLCGSAIVRILQGAAPGRSTYYCPKCQCAANNE